MTSTEKLENKTVPPDLLNESVHLEKNVVFIAIPKNGTTTVRRQLYQTGNALIPNPHLSILQVRDTLYSYLLLRSLARNRRFPTGAVPTDNELREQSSKLFNSFFKFASVRNPWARAVSLYLRREGVRVCDAMSFDEFCDKHFYASDTCLHPTLFNNQYDWLCDEEGRNIMDYVYKVENFLVAVREIAERTDGRVKLTAERRNVNPRSTAARYRQFYSDKSRKAIAKRFEMDIDYFGYTF